MSRALWDSGIAQLVEHHGIAQWVGDYAIMGYLSGKSTME